MHCLICNKKLRSDNTHGHCRKHRNISAHRREYMENYAKDNEKIKKYKRQWAKDNVEKLNKQCIIRRQTRPTIKLAHALRTRLNKLVGARSGSPIAALGCTLEQFKLHIESQFLPGMTWENHGLRGWHLDHIIGLCNFDLTDPEQYALACHYTNIRPLWAKDNLTRKKRNITLPRVPDAQNGR